MAPAGYLFFLYLVLIAWYDLSTGIIPNILAYTGMGLGLTLSYFYPATHFQQDGFAAFRLSLSGLLLGAAMIYAADFLGGLLLKKRVLGYGDLKLLAMIGSFLGWKKVLAVFLTAPFLCLPFAVYFWRTKGKETIPYGPFLCLSAAIHFFI